MTKISTLKTTALLFVAIFFSLNSLKAQTIPTVDELEISAFLRAGSADASTLLGYYLRPVFTGFNYGANTGWYNTAKAHKLGGFDLTMTVCGVRVPESAWSFIFNEADYINTKLAGSSTTGATVFGNQNSLTLSSSVTQSGVTIATKFHAPPGLDYSKLPSQVARLRGYVPFVMLQGGVGLFKNTDLKIRWLPKSSLKNITGLNMSVGMLGFGIMHDFKQWIPSIKHIPIALSVLVGFNRLLTDIDISARGLPGNNQKAEFSINTLTYQLLVSKKISFLTLYGGVGINQATTKLKFLGTYVVADFGDIDRKIILTDPVNEQFKSNGFRATLGMRLKLGVMTLSGDYTFQEYNTASAGIGFSLR